MLWDDAHLSNDVRCGLRALSRRGVPEPAAQQKAYAQPDQKRGAWIAAHPDGQVARAPLTPLLLQVGPAPTTVSATVVTAFAVAASVERRKAPYL
jgi:hypothetical protein